MPRLNSLQHSSLLKINDETKPIPVVMPTGSDTMEDTSQAFGEEDAGYILKPAIADVLENTINWNMSKIALIESRYINWARITPVSAYT